LNHPIEDLSHAFTHHALVLHDLAVGMLTAPDEYVDRPKKM